MTLVWSDWQDDADDVWADSRAGANLGATWHVIETMTPFGTAPNVTDLWAGIASAGDNVDVVAPADYGPGPSFFRAQVALSDVDRGTSQWNMQWVTVVSRAGQYEVTSATVPSAVASDPTVVAVEWEPSSTPLGQRIDVTLTASDDGSLPAYLKLITSGVPTDGTAYDPGFLTGGAVAGIPTTGTFTASGTQSIDASGLFSLYAPGAFAVGVVDKWTQSQSYTPGPPGDVQGASLPVSVQFLSRFHLRYRVARLSTIQPPLRQYPRTDGLGASSTRRVWPPSRSVQGSNRRVGGYL